MVSRMGTLSLADGFDSAGTTAYNGTLDLTGGTVDGLISTLTVGRNASSGTGTGSATATMSFDAGTVDATTVNLGGQTGANRTPRVTGALNVSGTASLIAGTLNIGRDAGTNTGFGTGTLNVGGGSVLVTGNVVENNGDGRHQRVQHHQPDRGHDEGQRQYDSRQPQPHYRHAFRSAVPSR